MHDNAATLVLYALTSAALTCGHKRVARVLGTALVTAYHLKHLGTHQIKEIAKKAGADVSSIGDFR